MPTILTIWIFVQCYLFIQDNVSGHINKGLVWIIMKFGEVFPAIAGGNSKEFHEQFWVYGPGRITGFVLAIVGVCFIGAFLASFAGKTIWHIAEKAFARIPLIKKVYPNIKQITDFVLAKKEMSFNKVVAVQYPRKGIWSIALVTGTGLKKITDAMNQEFLTVFVPTSPTPFTGYVIVTPKAETIELDMTVEEALRFTVSAGVISPADREEFDALANKDDKKDVKA